MDTKEYILFSEAYAGIYTENQIEPEGEVISEMPEIPGATGGAVPPVGLPF